MKSRTSIAILLVSLFFLLVTGSGICAEKDTQSDLWLKAKIITTYTLNENLNPFTLNVDVINGVAVLSGTVDNDIEKDLAGEIAQGVEGIREVKNNISIDPEMYRKQTKPPEESAFYRKVKDASITAMVKSRLVWNRNTDGLDVDVDTQNNVVTLSGTVDSDVQKDLVVQVAKNTNGVRRVKDNLQVSKEMEKGEMEKSVEEIQSQVTDAWITTKIKTELFFSTTANGSDINVSTDNGVVTLQGTVTSKQQKEDIIKMVEDGRYVKSVKSDLSVIAD